MFALMPFMENFSSFTDSFPAHWEPIRMKYNIAFTLALLPGQQFNTGGGGTYTCYHQQNLKNMELK